ncbi:Peptidoglycan-recognition protein LF, partial [Blattella germanica]
PPVSPFNPNTTLPNGRRIYLKSDWYGEPPKFERQLQLPAPFVVISHTVTQPCYEFKTCAESMRTMQGVQVTDNDLPDLGYSFVVGNDGNVYEGRGWDVTNMHIGFVRRCNIGIALMGNFVHDEPTIGQINSTQELLELGVKLGKIAPDYKLIPHNATYATLTPPDTPDAYRTLPGGWRVLSKEIWFGQPAKYERPLQHPTPFVVISETATEPCFTTVSCMLQVRMMQDDAMSGPNSDIDCNFVIGGEGNVYIGRGWDVANTYEEAFVKYNNIGISVNGNFDRDIPTSYQINATRELIERGIELGKISPDYKLMPLSRINNSLELNPGKNFYKIIEKWPHFWVPP